MTQVYTYEIVGQLFGTNLIQSGSIEDANQQSKIFSIISGSSIHGLYSGYPTI